jgi:NAD(P)-dependent dehydrogenase (short-subunit alcohol dehydrogenase family)
VAGYDLQGKTALVTGGARGIGYEAAMQMQARGASVVIVDLDAEEVGGAAEAIGDRAVGIGADVTEPAAMAEVVDEAVARFGGVDLVIPAAGVLPSAVATVRGMRFEEWERVFEVDFLGVWRTVRAALPQVAERQGQIVVTSSIFAFVNGIFNSPYAIAKAGGEALGRALRAELAPFGASATVAYFAAVETDLLRESLERPYSDRMEETLPGFLKKRIQPSEAAEALVRGIERRAPRIFAPPWWRYAFALRGVLMPLVDRRLERDARTAEILRDVEAESETAGRL